MNDDKEIYGEYPSILLTNQSKELIEAIEKKDPELVAQAFLDCFATAFAETIKPEEY